MEAREDLARLADHLFERELLSDGDLAYAEEAIVAIEASLTLLEKYPYTCRKSADNSFMRELVMPSGSTGYVALFEILSSDRIVTVAIRHHREDDYY